MNKKLFSFLGIFIALLYGYKSNAQLAGGTYTINSAAPTAGTNYASFTAAIGAMSSGITGAVTFNVVPGSGPYTEQVTIGNITGASVTNTIKFNGNGASVQYTPTTTYAGNLMMNGAKYVKFDSLTFKSLSTTYGYGAILYNACDYDSVTRCTFDLTGVVSTASANCSGIRISSTASGTSSTVSGATNTFLGSNSILGTTATGGPYYGFYFYGPNTNNVYYNNYMSNYYYYGFSDYYGANVSYLNNTLTRATKTSATVGYYGFYLYYLAAGSKISGNMVNSLGGATPGTSYCYPFTLSGAKGTATNPVLVTNNLISNMTFSPYQGMSVSSCDYVNVDHNTISIDVPVAYTNANYGIYLSYCNNNNVRNNNISITGGGTSTKYGLYYTGNTSLVSNYNNVYVNSTQTGTQNYGYQGAVYATYAAFRAANPTLEANGLTVNPLFTAPAAGNFKPGNYALIGVGANLLSTVPVDITGGPRAASPTIGAYEVTPTIANNAGIASALSNPVDNYCTGAQQIKVAVNNSGTNNITTLQVNWMVNGVLQTPYAFTGTLVPLTATSGSRSSVVTVGNANLIAGTNTIKIWTSLPNGTADGDPSNDTMTATLTPATFSVASSVDTVCTSSSFVLNLTPSAGYATGALQWQSSPDGVTWTPITGTDTVTYAGSGLSVTSRFRAQILTGGTGCYSPSKTIVLSNPVILSTAPATRCGLGTLTLGAVPGGSATLTWYDSLTGGTALYTGNNFTTPLLTATKTFYVAATIGGTQPTGKITPVSTTGNSGFSDVGLMFNASVPFVLTSVDVYPMGTTTSGTVTIALKNSAGTVLQTATVPVTVSAAGALNTIPLNFAVPAGTGHRLVVMAATGVANLIRESTTGFTYPYTLPGISSITSAYTSGASSSFYYYLYNWKVTTGCSAARIPVTATIGAAPAIAASASATTICGGSSTTLNVTSANLNYRYSWSSGQTTSSFTASPVNTITYKVTATDSTTNCTAVDSVTVNVINQSATITPAGVQTICTGNNIVLSANTGTGLSYQWFNGGVAVSGATAATYTAATTGIYTVRVTNITAGCSNTSAGVTVNVVPPPAATIIPGSAAALCSGDTLVLQGPAGTGYTYQWKKDGVNATGAATGVTYRATTAGAYTLVVSANGCSTTSAATSVTIVSLPVPAISPSAALAGCDSVVFTSATANATFQWYYNGLPVIGGNNASYTATVTGQYSVKVTSVTNGCAATSANVTATVNRSPEGRITYSSPISFCEGGAVVLGTYTEPNTTYQWMLNGAAIVNATNPNYIASATGLYSITVMNTVTGCGKVATPVQVQVVPTPVPVITYDMTNNILSTTVPYMRYQWRMNNQPVAGATGATYSPAESGAFAVSVTDSNGCMGISTIKFVNNVGITHTALGAALKVYPNPTMGIVHITSSETVKFVVKDLAGKTIASGTSNEAIDLSAVADGIYLLNITDKENRLIRAEKLTKGSR